MVLSCRRKLWWVTRPTRDLHDVAESLKSFASIARGKKWRGNRALHQKFEMENLAKTSNRGKYGSAGSGGRTWAAWLKMWGFWYDEKCATLTDAGDLIVSTKNPEHIHNQIVHMIMTFQITSAYHERLRPRQASGFKIFPFRFMLKLLLDAKVKFLSTDEIGLFLLQVKKPNEYNGVVDKILEWRNKCKNGKSRQELHDVLVKQHMKKYHNPRSDSPTNASKYWISIRDIAHTLMLNIRYINELKFDDGKGIISIPDKDRKAVTILLKKYNDIPFSSLYTYSEATFMRKFGIMYCRRKASRKDTSPMTSSKKQHRRITDAIDTLNKKGTKLTHIKLLQRVHEITHYQKEVIEKVISENPGMIKSNYKIDRDFTEHYLNCGKDGKQHAEFEILTREIFSLMGFKTDKMKIPKQTRGKPEIDGLILGEEVCLSGILECKSGAKYTFSVGDCDKMKHTYIKNFKTKKIDGKKYSLDFFVYVIGTTASGLDNFKEIISDTKIRGSVIYAEDLIRLYSMFNKGKADPIKIWGLFKCNKRITREDIELLCI